VAFVVSLNLHRRHLNESQRALVAAKIADLDEGRPDKTAQTCAVSQDDAADMLSVSRRSVQSAKKVLDDGTLTLVSKVESGEVAVSTAADIADLDEEEQEEIVARGKTAYTDSIGTSIFSSGTGTGRLTITAPYTSAATVSNSMNTATPVLVVPCASTCCRQHAIRGVAITQRDIR